MNNKIVIFGIVSLLLSSIIIAISTFLKPHKQEQDHQIAGTSFLSLYYDARVFCEVESIRKNKQNNQLLSELHGLIKQRDDLDKRSPRIPTSAWNKAEITSEAHFKKEPITRII